MQLSRESEGTVMQMKLGMDGKESFQRVQFHGMDRRSGDRREGRDKLTPGLGSGNTYGNLNQNMIPSCNFMGEENEVNLREVILGCLRNIQRGEIPEIFVFSSL